MNWGVEGQNTEGWERGRGKARADYMMTVLSVSLEPISNAIFKEERFEKSFFLFSVAVRKRRGVFGEPSLFYVYHSFKNLFSFIHNIKIFTHNKIIKE